MAIMRNGKTITERTLIPLSVVFVLLGGAAWITTVASDAKSSKDDIAQMKLDRRDDLKVLQKIDEKVSRVEGKIDAMRDERSE